MEDKAFYTRAEAAKQWGVTGACVSIWLKKGLVPGATRMGHKWRIPRDTVRKISEKGLDLSEGAGDE